MKRPQKPLKDANILLGCNLRRLRISCGLTQKDLAAQIGVTYQQLQKYEAGQSPVPAARLYMLHIILDVPLARFFDEGATLFPSLAVIAGLHRHSD